MIARLAALALLLTLLAACTSPLRPGPGPESGPGSAVPALGEVPAAGNRYEVEAGRDAATVAAMRAAPAPAEPELTLGRNRAGDQRQLADRGFVHIGTGYATGDEAEVREIALLQGRAVGADRILLYAPSSEASADWVATYYVRFALPFGATFRDLRSEERAELGSGGVVIGSVIDGTPASRANLIAGDIVLTLNGEDVGSRGAFQALLKKNTGRAVTLGMVRNGVSLERVVRLGAMPGAAR